MGGRKKNIQLPYCGYFWNGCLSQKMQHDCIHCGNRAMILRPPKDDIQLQADRDNCPYLIGSKYSSQITFIGYHEGFNPNVAEWAWDRGRLYIQHEELPISTHRVIVHTRVETARGSGKYVDAGQVKTDEKYIWANGGTGFLALPFIVYTIGDIPTRRLCGQEVNAAVITEWIDSAWDDAQVMLGMDSSAVKIIPDKCWARECKLRKEKKYVEPTPEKLAKGRYARKGGLND